MDDRERERIEERTLNIWSILNMLGVSFVNFIYFAFRSGFYRHAYTTTTDDDTNRKENSDTLTHANGKSKRNFQTHLATAATAVAKLRKKEFHRRVRVSKYEHVRSDTRHPSIQPRRVNNVIRFNKSATTQQYSCSIAALHRIKIYG